MLLADVLPDPSKDDVTIYELPDLNHSDAVILPVLNCILNKNYYYRPHLDEFGLPFYIVLLPDEVHNYQKIYEKIRNKYAQFSSAEELHTLADPEIADEVMMGDDSMEEVVLTRQDLSHAKMVTLRLQQYTRSLYVRQGESEMPTQAERPENLHDLKEWLLPPVPPMSRMQSLAPSAMESIHQGDLSTPPESDPGNNSDGTVFVSQPSTFVDDQNSQHEEEEQQQPLQENQEEEFVDMDTRFSEEPLIDEIPEDSSNDLRFSDSDKLDHHSTPSMTGSDEENITPSQIGRAHAPSPISFANEEEDHILPSYSEIYPSTTESIDPIINPHFLKYGDAIICEWSDTAYNHVFSNPRTITHWDNFSPWIDPNPPPPPKTPPKLNLDLEDCLNEFGKEEELGQDDLWYCPRCKEHRQAKKTLQLWRVPDIFAVHLKRFSANRGFRDKLDNLIEFPIVDLDLTERVGDKKWISEERGGEKLIYDLFAVDNHFGGLGGGHYTAYAQNFIDGKWYYFDGNSSPISTSMTFG